MARAKAISLHEFTTAVHGAVKAAMVKHPKFKFELPQGIEFSYLIRGFPVPEAVLNNVTLAETQAFANEIAGHLSNSQPEALADIRGGNAQGAIYSSGRHVILGIPPVVDPFLLER